ncbi:unnamed protein product [Lepeophtheirus salmonis]|uniref:(salmon louse) hypothetical protein n=1 Tax=Lepeophtheirus salmonis TaxID=72036 RepID=A0A7R8CTL8_LEPSM|nr:unnamed protein product [Lepeophtheirus salmonis]CAF2874680.1 unnamed protein product [Lepeophtheirus salmonis]
MERKRKKKEREREEEDTGLTFSRELGDGESTSPNNTIQELPAAIQKKASKSTRNFSDRARRSRSEVRRQQQKTEPLDNRAWSKSPVKCRYRRPKNFLQTKPIPDLSERLSNSSSTSSFTQSLEKKRRNKFADVIRLPEPYGNITSDEVKRWCKDLKKHRRLSRLGKQGLINKQSLLLLVCDIAGYEIEEKHIRKSTYSLFEFSRKLSIQRESCQPLDKIKLDLLGCTWEPPVATAREVPQKRPPTAKPMEPEFYEFEDKKIEADYKKLWAKCRDLENYQNILQNDERL